MAKQYQRFMPIPANAAYTMVMVLCWVAWIACSESSLSAADFAQARSAYHRGDYEACIEISKAEVEKGIWNDIWSRQWIEALLITGRYAEACQVYEQVSERFSRSLPLRMLAAQAYRFAGQHEKGNRLLNEIPELVQAAPYQYSDRDNLLAIGRYVLSLGEDARAVLDAFYDRSLRSDSKFVDAHVAIAELALDKADYQEAVKSLSTAIELRPEDPQLHYLMAKAWAPSDSKRATEELLTALDLNPRHVATLLMQAENLINSEEYDAAEKTIEQVLAVNPSQPVAWSQQAAIAHLRGNYQREGECRKRALATWELNPEVDHTIGRLLSQHYRFEEGVQYQRRSLRMAPNYLPTKFQLAQDLLRAGKSDEGWSIVDQVAAADKYNVVAFNLKTLQERLAQFETLERDGLIVRMEAQEAKVYGERVLQLLGEARQVLAEKYEHELALPITVEIFPHQSDFAIRTFGLPGGAGFLGVCFGSLITANSPASQGNVPANWESVLWHEFCHVVTLQKTNNRMPRWLSEGISVYEEVERDPSWGQSLSPLYRKMLLGEDFVPLSDLSSAFLSPKSPLHLQFAYFESSLAVRYLVERHGQPLLQKLLVDLGAGVPLQAAFDQRYGAADLLDQDFEEYVHQLAESFLPATDFEKPDLSPQASVVELKQWLEASPTNYAAQQLLTEKLIAAKEWPAARAAAEALRDLYPQDTEPRGGWELLAKIGRQMADRQLERESLEQLVTLSSDNLPALQRLVQICREEKSWDAMAKHAEQLLAIQPLLPTGHEALVEAAQQLKRPGVALDSLRALQAMQPLDPAGLHFQVAQVLADGERLEEARREVLLALEETPRYRAAQKLLSSIHQRLQPIPVTQAALAIAAPDAGTPPSPNDHPSLLQETKSK